MKKLLKPHNVALLLAALVVFSSMSPAQAETASMKRVQIQTSVAREVNKDLAATYDAKAGLEFRRCIDGRAVKDVQGDIIEYWANLEWCAV